MNFESELIEDFFLLSNGGSFTPTDIPGLALWLDASDAATITLDGSNNVSQWSDKSGNARHASQETALNRPSYTGSGQVNGINCPTFNGTNHFLLTPAVTLSQPTTVFIALRPTSNSWFRGIYDGSITRNAIFGNAGVVDIHAGTSLPGTTALTLNSASQITAVFNGASSSTRVNRAARSSGNAGTDSLTGGVHVGRSYNSYWEGQIAEVVAYSGTLSTTQRDAVESYLASRWGTP